MESSCEMDPGDLTVAFQVDERTHLQLYYLQRNLSNRVEPRSGVRGHNGCGWGQQTQLEITSMTCSLYREVCGERVLRLVERGC